MAKVAKVKVKVETPLPTNGLRLEWMDADELRENPANWRRHPKAQVDALEGVLADVGWAGALLYNEGTGRLVDGHLRKEVAGRGKVPVLVGNWTEAQEREILATLDPLGAMAQPDMDALVKLLAEVETGNDAIKALLEGLANGETLPLRPGLTDDDEIPEEVETICKTGDLWQLGQHRLLCGDATKQEDVERLMGGEKAGMVFTDPPYGINIVKGISPAAIGGAKPFGRVRPPGCLTLGVLGGDSGRLLEKLTGKVGKPGIVKPRLYYPIIGDDKPFDPAFLLKLAPLVILFGANHYASRLPDSPGWLVWDKGIGDKATFSACELLWSNRNGHIKLYEYHWSGMIRAGKRDEELKERVHPTQKPVGLCQMILADTKTEIILDLFGGSGSTLIACEKLGRKCRMMEIDNFYTSVIIKRWMAFTGKEAIREDGRNWTELELEMQTANKNQNTTKPIILKTKRE